MEESNLNRRNFIKTSFGALVFTAFAGSPFKLLAAKDYKKLTILNTNDVHSHLKPFESGKNKGKGGVAARYTMIKKIRKTEKNVLLLDAGDIFQGTPLFNFYKGEIDIKMMSKLGYDAATIGNHDFDAGIDQLAKNLEFANFNFISSNYDFTDTILEKKIKKRQIFEKDGIKIGVYGLGVELEGLVPKELYKNTKYIDPTETALKEEEKLKNKKNCDFIICLSHLGYKYENKKNKISDFKLAKNLKHTNLIVGGHTHTFMTEPDKVMNKSGDFTYIFQAGKYGLNLGRLDFYFEKDKKGSSKAVKQSSKVLEMKNNLI